LTNIHHEIWNEIHPYIKGLIVGFICIISAVFVIFITNELKTYLFHSYIPLPVDLLITISEIEIIYSFVKNSIRSLDK